MCGELKSRLGDLCSLMCYFNHALTYEEFRKEEFQLCLKRKEEVRGLLVVFFTTSPSAG